MELAIELAKEAAKHDEVPVGAVLVKDNQLIAQGFNQPISSHDPTAHAEIVTLRAASLALHNYRLPNSTLYVTLEPCAMCAGALIHARVERVVFGAREPKAGAVCSHLQLFQESFFNHQVKVTEGILKDECANLLSEFFLARRQK